MNLQKIKSIFGAIMCCAGFHKYRTRVNAKATEIICMRDGCSHRMIYTVKADGTIKTFREHKNSLVRRVQK